MPDVIPDRYQYAVVAHIMIDGAAEAIDFYQRALSAVELFRLTGPDGTIVHAEIRIGCSVIMVGDAASPFRSPRSLGGSTVGLHVYVDDVDDRGAPRNSYRCTRPRTKAATRELPAIGCSAARTRPPPSFQATTSSASSPIKPARSPPAAASRNPVSSRTCSSRVVVPRRAPAEIRCRARAASCRQCTTAELAPSGRCGPG